MLKKFALLTALCAALVSFAHANEENAGCPGSEPEKEISKGEVSTGNDGSGSATEAEAPAPSFSHDGCGCNKGRK